MSKVEDDDIIIDKSKSGKGMGLNRYSDIAHVADGERYPAALSLVCFRSKQHRNPDTKSFFI